VEKSIYQYLKLNISFFNLKHFSIIRLTVRSNFRRVFQDTGGSGGVGVQKCIWPDAGGSVGRFGTCQARIYTSTHQRSTYFSYADVFPSTYHLDRSTWTLESCKGRAARGHSGLGSGLNFYKIKRAGQGLKFSGPGWAGQLLSARPFC